MNILSWNRAAVKEQPNQIYALISLYSPTLLYAPLKSPDSSPFWQRGENMKQFGFTRKYETICPEVKTFHEMLTLLEISHQAAFSSLVLFLCIK